MAPSPLNRRKITKKITKIPGRFQAHEYKRVNVSSISKAIPFRPNKLLTLFFYIIAKLPQSH